MSRKRLRSRMAACASLSLVAACVATRTPAGALDPRFVAVHNALSSLGLAQVGPIHEGTLAEGHEARVSLDLQAGCATIVALGGDGVRDLDASLLDGKGQPVAHDTTGEPQATLHACVERGDAYTLVVKAAAGAGSWVAATWEGGAAEHASASAAPPSAHEEALGTCESPILLTPGTVSGSTVHGEQANTGSCERSDAREMVYELDVPQRERVTIDLEARFDSVLYIRKDDCSDDAAEVDCNDDAPGGGRNRSHIEHVLDPGRYFAFVDGYNQEAGAYKMTVAVAEVVSLEDACRRAPLLTAGTAVTGTTLGAADDAQASCGGGAPGADAPWRVELASRSRVRIVEHSDDTAAVVHVRRACVDVESEVACGESGAATGDAALTGVFDAGRYAVFADAREREAAGHYTLALDVAPPDGSGTTGDGCGDALPLRGSALTVAGDTFAARDDVSGSCGGAGAADVVYRVDVPRRSRLVAGLEAEEGPHVLVASRRCGDRSAEVACGRVIDEVLAPGTYFVAVDGAAPHALGRFTLTSTLQDLTAQAGACAAAPRLVEGRSLAGSTSGAGDKFATSCASGGAGASGPDRVYALSLPSRATVRIAVDAPSFDVALALRKACADGAGAERADELACEADGDVAHRTTLERTLEAGTYWVVVDGATPDDQGGFSIAYRVVR